ncbi:20S-pre-rRNA D-site endonuclease nob1 [Pelomyxa schiedti]|nr:20S-pre-rRNA D-site endonuclease nob1 [Pelomyxa schiedti]
MSATSSSAAMHKVVVVDTNILLRNLRMEKFGERIVTVPEVIREVRDKRSREQLALIPYVLEVADPSPDSWKRVVQFSKETGDFIALSHVDLKVLALAHTFHCELVGADTLATKPGTFPQQGDSTSPLATTQTTEATCQNSDLAENTASSTTIPTGRQPPVQTTKIMPKNGSLVAEPIDPSKSLLRKPPTNPWKVTPERVPPQTPHPLKESVLPKKGKNRPKDNLQLPECQVSLSPKPLELETTKITALPPADTQPQDKATELLTQTQESTPHPEPLIQPSTTLPTVCDEGLQMAVKETSEPEAPIPQTPISVQSKTKDPMPKNETASNPQLSAPQIKLPPQASQTPEAAIATTLTAQTQSQSQTQSTVQQQEITQTAPAQHTVPKKKKSRKPKNTAQVTNSNAQQTTASTPSETVQQLQGSSVTTQHSEQPTSSQQPVQPNVINTPAEEIDSAGNESNNTDASAEGWNEVTHTKHKPAPKEKPFGGFDFGTWISVDNLNDVRYKLTGNLVEGEDYKVPVGCMTADYAMQNVLMLMGINVISVDGLKLQIVRQSLLKCHSCYSVTRDVSRRFCPKCGNGTLRRVFVETSADGTVQEVIPMRVPTTKNSKVTLPLPRGGRRPGIILCEDVYKEAMRKAPQRKVRAPLAKVSSETFIDGLGASTIVKRKRHVVIGFNNSSSGKHFGKNNKPARG